MKKIIILIFFILIIIVLAEFLYLVLLPSIKKEAVEKQTENLPIECRDLILNSRWKNILEEKSTSYIYLSKIEDIQFNKKFANYFYPLIVNLNKKENLIIFFTNDELEKIKVYSLVNNKPIPYDYKKLKKGDKIKIQITTSMLKNNENFLKEISIIRFN